MTDVPARRRKARDVRKALLNSGDQIEYGLTAEIKHRGSSWWVKVGSSTTIQDGESETEAKRRLRVSVHEMLEEAIAEVKA